jgi:subtilase family protein
VGEQPIARRDQPSPFTRRGPSVGGAIKPELMAYGGNWAVNERTANRWTIKRGLGELSTCMDFAGGRLLAEDIGTSFAAPAVAHLAARILIDHPNASANLLRALLVAHARWTEAEETLLADLDQRFAIVWFRAGDRRCAFSLR